jgi:hypothetical protein
MHRRELLKAIALAPVVAASVTAPVVASEAIETMPQVMAPYFVEIDAVEWIECITICSVENTSIGDEHVY